jgi:hypothetical protein
MGPPTVAYTEACDGGLLPAVGPAGRSPWLNVPLYATKLIHVHARPLTLPVATKQTFQKRLDVFIENDADVNNTFLRSSLRGLVCRLVATYTYVTRYPDKLNPHLSRI